MPTVNDKFNKDRPDRRKNPRIAFHVPVSVMGMSQTAKVVDFSLNGFFIQMDAAGQVQEGQQIRIALRFPHENASTILKAKVVRTEKNGFGCQFVDLSSSLMDLLEKNFDIFSATLPI
jgi:hypothetical protein